MSYFNPSILDQVILGNPVMTWVIATTAFLIIFGILKTIILLLVGRLKKRAEQIGADNINAFINAIKTIGWPFYCLASLYIALDILNTSALLQQWVYYAFFISAVFYSAQAITVLIDHSADKIIKGNEGDRISGLRKVIKVLVWIVGAIILLSNFGYDVTSLLAGLGIGGLAVAYGSQQITTDVIAAFTIYLDKPFKVGDKIAIGAFEGIVTKIGIRSVRMKTATGEEVVVPNKEAAGTMLKNLSRK